MKPRDEGQNMTALCIQAYVRGGDVLSRTKILPILTYAGSLSKKKFVVMDLWNPLRLYTSGIAQQWVVLPVYYRLMYDDG